MADCTPNVVSRPEPAVEPGFATLQIQAGYQAGKPQHTSAVPIYQSNAFEFSSLSEARALFALEQDGNIYSRAANPTLQVLEERVAALEGGKAASAVASGQAAVAVALLALARSGEHIVAAKQLYGGTIDLLNETFRDWGIETTFVDQDDLDAWRKAVQPNTRAFFAESVTNPTAQVLLTTEIAYIAHAAGVPLVIDNTVATPFLHRPKEYGADISVHSATKFIGGHGSSLGGLVVDLGTFDFTAEPERWPQINDTYHRVPHGSLAERYSKRGSAYIALVKTKYVHDLGPSLSAFNAFQLLQGLETLDIRMLRHSQNADAVATALAEHPAVTRVLHPVVATGAEKAAAERYFPRGNTSVFSFEVASTGDADLDFSRIEQLIAQLSLLRLVANIGDARSLIAHPASMTHSHMSEEQLREAGISGTTSRLSIGLESADEIIADLNRALNTLL